MEQAYEKGAALASAAYYKRMPLKDKGDKAKSGQDISGSKITEI